MAHQRTGLFRPAPGSKEATRVPRRSERIEKAGFDGAETQAGTIPNPAATVAELHGQLGNLLQAFVSAEGREPEPADDPFWESFATLCNEYRANASDLSPEQPSPGH